MKGKNYLKMMENATTSTEAHSILCEADDVISKVMACEGEYSNWTDEELSEYLDMLYSIDEYYYEHFYELHTPREIKVLDDMG